MSETIQYQVIGTIDRKDVDRGAPRFLLVSTDGRYAMLAHQVGKNWLPVAGPYTLDLIRSCASNVLAGNPRAITWNEAQICLAIGAAVFFALAEHDTHAPAPEGVTGRHPSVPTLPDVPPGAAPDLIGSGVADFGEGRGAAQNDLFTATSCPSCGG